jgi:ABC-type uncharacterized transport system involved in gliding motility auxiliary subunit
MKDKKIPQDPASPNKARTGLDAFLVLAVIVGILIFVNLLLIRYPFRLDLTVDKENLLTDQSMNLLVQMPEPVFARAFFIQGLSPEKADKAVTLLEEFRIQSRGKFSYEVIDPQVEPITAQKAGVSGDGYILLTMNDQQQLVTDVNEQSLTDGLRRLLYPEEEKVYVLIGHGERDFQSNDRRGYSSLSNDLGLKNYSLEPLALLTVDSVPADADLVMIIGPERPFDPLEVERLDRYLAQGGGLSLWIDPVIFIAKENEPEPLTEYLAEKWGVILGEDIVVDLTINQATLVAYGVEYGNHPISAPLDNDYTVFPGVRSVTLENRIDESISQQSLVLSGHNTWAEKDLQVLIDEDVKVSPEEGVDFFGPVPIATAAENFKNEARIVVTGDADFGSNAFYHEYANRELIMNMVDWASKQERQIVLTPREKTQRVVIPPLEMVRNLIFFLIVLFLPFMFLFFGILVWVRHRRKV